MAQISLDGLVKLIEKDIEIILISIAQKTVDKLKEIVGEEWYGGHDASEYYVRFRDFLESIVSSKVRKIGNSYEIEIYFDGSKMPPELRPPGELNARMSVTGDTSWKGQSIADYWMPIFIEEGFRVPFANKHYDGIHMVEQTKEWLNTELNSIVMNEFRAKGYMISIK